MADTGIAASNDPRTEVALPDDLVDQIWSWFEKDSFSKQTGWFRPASKSQVRKLILTAFQASLRVDEARQVRLRILLTTEPSLATVPLEVPQQYTAGNL